MYSFYQILFYFFIYSFLGWCCEVCFRSVNSGKFVNSGFLNGPYCPVYGFGMVAVILLLTPVQDNLILLFVVSVAVTTVIEGLTGFALHKIFKTRWWDYTDMPFNYKGYVCLAFSLVWGLGAVFAIKLIHPAVAALVAWINYKLGIVLLVIFSAAFAADGIATVNILIKLNRDLGMLDDVARRLKNQSNFIAQRLGNAAIKADEVHDGMLLDLQAKQDMLRADITDARIKRYYRIMRAFPSMKHDSYDEQLQLLRKKFVD